MEVLCVSSALLELVSDNDDVDDEEEEAEVLAEEQR